MKLNTTNVCVFEIVYTLCNITASKHMKETQVNSSEVLRPFKIAPLSRQCNRTCQSSVPQIYRLIKIFGEVKIRTRDLYARSPPLYPLHQGSPPSCFQYFPYHLYIYKGIHLFFIVTTYSFVTQRLRNGAFLDKNVLITLKGLYPRSDVHPKYPEYPDRKREI